MSGIHFPGVALSLDTSAGDWIGRHLDPRSKHRRATPAGQVIPAVYESYARVFHPVPTRSGEALRWSDVAARCGRTVHAEMQWSAISSPSPGLASTEQEADGHPSKGNLGRNAAVDLAALLRPFTSTPNAVWFALWEGYAMLHHDASVDLRSYRPGRFRRFLAARRSARKRRSLQDGFEAIPKLHLESRSHLLYRGELSAVDAFHDNGRLHWYQSPNLWWPDDRRWCVATEIDLDSTLVGGPRAAIDAVLGAERLEALEISPRTRLDHRADRVNGSPG